MPAVVINPRDTDDLSAASITTNVTDKMVAWESSHETGFTTNGAVRHLSDQIDDVALPETTVPSSVAQANGLGVHARLDMFALVLSAVMGTSGTGYAAKYTQLGSLPYGTLNAISTALSSGASSAAGASTLVRRASDGSANFSGTVGVVALAGTGNWATTGSLSAASAVISGVIVAGSGARQITTADGHLDATQLSGAFATTAMPALTGDVVNATGSVVTTVSSVGGKTAAQVGTAVTAVLAASATGVGNHGAIAKYDGSGGMTFDAAVTAPTFVGSATTVADGAITTTKIAAYAVTRVHLSDGSVVAQPTPNKTVQVAPYNYYNSANVFGAPPGVSPAIDAVNALPSAGQQRYDLLYTDDAFSLGWLAGVPASSSPAKPTLAVGSTARPLAWAGPITNGTTTITPAMLFDARPSSTSGGGSSGGGGGGLPVATPIVTVGSDPTATNETDIFDLAAGRLTGVIGTRDRALYWQSAALVRSEDPAAVANAARLDQWIASDFEHRPGAYLTTSGNNFVLQPMTMQIGGVLKRSYQGAPAVQTTPVSPTPGLWYVIADYSLRADGSFILTATNAFPSSLSPSQRYVGAARHNGTSFIGDPDIDFSPLLVVTSTQMRPLKWHVQGYPTSGNAISLTSPAPVAFFNGTIDIPKTMDIRIDGYLFFTGASGSVGTAYLQIDSTVVGVIAPLGYGRSGAWEEIVPIGGALDGLSSGSHNVQVFAQVGGAGQTMTLYAGQWKAIAWTP